MYWDVTFEAMLLALSVSVDSFVTAVSYGARGIKIPIQSAAALCGVSTGIMLAFSALGVTIHGGKAVCFCVLIIIGLVRIFDSVLKRWIRKKQGRGIISFSALHLHFWLEIYADPELADMDHGGTLSLKEAILLAIILSVDGASAGFGAGSAGIDLWLVSGISFLLNAAALALGLSVGKKSAAAAGRDFSVFGGILMILLAICKVMK